MSTPDIIIVSSGVFTIFFAIIVITASILSHVTWNTDVTVKEYNATIIAISDSGNRYSSNVYPVFELANGTRYTVEIDGANLEARRLVVGDKAEIGIATDGSGVHDVTDLSIKNKAKMCVGEYC